MAIVKSTRIAEVRLKARSSVNAGSITSAATAALRVRSSGSTGGGGGPPGGTRGRKQREGEVEAGDGQDAVERERPGERAAGLLGLAGGDREHDGEGLQQHADERGLRRRLKPEGVEEREADEAHHQVGVLAQHPGNAGEGERQQRQQQRQHDDDRERRRRRHLQREGAEEHRRDEGQRRPHPTATP